MTRHTTVNELLEAWDKGDVIWTLSMGGLGPGYEQAIQITAIEFARAGKDIPRTGNDKEDQQAFESICNEALKAIDEKLGGISGAMFHAAKWIAWQWCFNGGPAALIKRAEEQGEHKRVIQCSSFYPSLK